MEGGRSGSSRLAVINHGGNGVMAGAACLSKLSNLGMGFAWTSWTWALSRNVLLSLARPLDACTGVKIVSH